MIVLAAIWLFVLFNSRSAASEPMTIGEFQSEVDAGNVVSAEFLLGDILAISNADLIWLLVGGTGAIAALIAIWRPLLSLSVHADIAAAEGTATDWVKLIFVAVLALVVAIAIKIVGALLTIAFLIMPAAAARPLARTPEQMAVIAGVYGMLAVAAGLFLSVTWDTPAGPSIVLVLAALFTLSIVPSVLRR